MSETQQIDTPLSDEERQALRALVGMIVPASTKYQIPGADDEVIFTDILTTATPHHAALSMALGALENVVGENGSSSFAELSLGQREDTVEIFRRSQPEVAGLISMLTVQCYYRDDRVMRSLAMDPRPPHPKGFDVEPGNWSLLDPVRGREKFWRDAR